MDLASTYDSSQKDVNLGEYLQGDSGVKGAQNLHAVTLYQYKSTFLLEPNKGTQIKNRLLIDRSSRRMKEIDLHDKIPQNYESKKNYSAFLGVMNILDQAFLFLVDEIVPVCNIENNDIFTISSVTFIPFEEENQILGSQSGKDALGYIQNIKKLLLQGYYFSYTYDLTLSKVKRATNCQTEIKFQWNNYILKDLKKYGIDKKWQVSLVQGYIGSTSVFMQGKKLEYFLISRRSCFKAGTRYNARGIDDEGNVANFVETEQIIYYNGYCCSSLQVRGSVPLFWQQTGVTAATKITRSFDLTNDAFLKHFASLNENYGRVLCINLMAKSKKDEQMITDGYEEHLKENGLSNVRYEFFDFHHACKGHRYDKVNPLITKLQPMIENFRFYAEDTVKKTIQLTQKGIVRTNCMDCLDRTNVVQGKVAMIMFDAIMRQLGVDLNQTFGSDVLTQLDNNNPKQQHQFIVNFKHIWAENADIISMHYSGTGSVISTVTRTGKKDFFGMLDHGYKTLSRFYINNFEDQVKQECIDILLGQHTESKNIYAETFERAIKQKEKEYASYSEMSLFIVAWNLAAFHPTQHFDLTNLFNFEGNSPPDIVVIGFQEFVDLGVKAMMSGVDQNKVTMWKEVFLNNLNKFGNYIPVKEQGLVGMLLLVFVKEEHRTRVTKVETDVVKTGLAGSLGNKGAVCVKFMVDDSSFGFINVHMEAGTKNNNARLMNLIDIHNKAFQSGGIGKKKEERIINLDYKFLLGDTNFRLTESNANVRAMIDDYQILMGNNKKHEANDILSTLLGYDQLNLSRSSNDILDKYQEGAITFLPTYKYDSYSNVYDSSKKQRTPSWTDRILWSCNFGIVKQYFYTRREYKESDHRPVVSYFNVEVKKIDEAKKEEIFKQVYENDSSIKTLVQKEEEALREEEEIRQFVFEAPKRDSGQEKEDSDLLGMNNNDKEPKGDDGSHKIVDDLL